MPDNKINPIIKWWVTPKLPYHDVYEVPLLINKSKIEQIKFVIKQWTINPIKRRLARYYLRILKKFTDITVIGITGSAGKTTTKEMVYSILKREAKTICTTGFIDPVYNIPNTILKTPPGTKYLILEMGVEYKGEMDFYLWLAEPDVGVITNIFPTHIEFFENEEGVFKEKSKLVKSIQDNGISVLNSGDKYLKRLEGKLASQIKWFKPNTNPIIQNSNTATVIARSLGVSEEKIANGLKHYSSPAHRLITINLKSGAKILDDSYNSNLKAALSTLRYFNSKFSGRKIAVVGEMRELGQISENSHRLLGREIAKSGFEFVFGIGKETDYLISEINKYSKKTKTFQISDHDEVVNLIKPLLESNTAVFVKGARSLRLDKIVEKLKKLS